MSDIKNRKIYIYIYIYIYLAIVACVCAGLIVLANLGHKERDAYLTELYPDMQKTLTLNHDTKNVNDFITREDFDIYIKAHGFSIYAYTFKVSPISKFFKKNAFYSIYPDINLLPPFLEQAKLHDKRTHGSFISKAYVKDNEITIPYTLALNRWLIISLAILGIFIGICLIAFPAIKRYAYTNFALKDNNICYVDSYSLKNVFSMFSMDIYSLLFYIYVIVIACFIFSFQIISPMSGDDWAFSSSYSAFYDPTQFKGVFWQRGRHISEVLMSFSMRPFGMMLVSFGMDPLVAFKIVSSSFAVLYYFFLFFGISLFVWLMNDKKDFKLIFSILSLFSINLLESGNITFIVRSAYVATAGIALLVFLPMLYYFLYQRELRFSKNVASHFAIVLILAYFGTFLIETSSLPIFALCATMCIYYYYCKIKGGIYSFSVAYYLGLLLFFVAVAFILTLVSGRGKAQIHDVGDTSLFGNIAIYLHAFHATHSSFACIMILSCIALLGFIIYAKKKRHLSKKYYIVLSLLVIGLVGIIGFSAIKVPGIWFEVILLFLALFILLLQYRMHSNKTFAFVCNVLLIGSMFCMIFPVVSTYERVFLESYSHKDAPENLKELFQKANKDNSREIVLTKEDIKTYHLEYLGLSRQAITYPNYSISYFMQLYGVTDRFINLRVID